MTVGSNPSLADEKRYQPPKSKYKVKTPLDTLGPAPPHIGDIRHPGHGKVILGSSYPAQPSSKGL